MSELEEISAFAPGPAALPAPDFAASLRIEQTPMQFAPQLTVTRVGARDTRLFPRVSLDFFTLDGLLVPLQWGCMVAEDPAQRPSSYWSLIPQFGRVWRDPAGGGDGGGDWSRAAFPVMLVNDLENHAHQGVARFSYKEGEVRDFTFQFVQQTTPYLVKPHFVAWGVAPVRCLPLEQGFDIKAAARRVRRELSGRLPVEAGTADLAAGTLDPEWIVAGATVHPTGAMQYHVQPTLCGPYPYPLEMRFGVRSILKSIAAPLSLLRLAQLHGPEVLDLKIGRYVSGLHEKFNEIRFIDAANMATGFGGTGTLQTQPNDFDDGCLGADYDGWYTAASHGEKLAHIAKWLRPYPWPPGTVLRYRDQDYYLLGAAIDSYLKSVRGLDAEAWDMLTTEVFAPIGINAAPTTRTREPGGERGMAWFNAGYFPTLDDLAKIALLYQRRGEWNGQQILHRELTADLLSGRGALPKRGPSWGVVESPGALTHYRMGFHFRFSVPVMWASGESEIILHRHGGVSIRIAKAPGYETRVSRCPCLQVT